MVGGLTGGSEEGRYCVYTLPGGYHRFSIDDEVKLSDWMLIPDIPILNIASLIQKVHAFAL